MTKNEKKRVKAAIEADKLLVDCRINLRAVASLCGDAGDREAEALIYAAVSMLSSLAIYAVKKQRVEVDESK